MRFAAPESFWLLLLMPLLAAFLAWAWRARRRALERFAAGAMVERLTEDVQAARRVMRILLLLSGVLLTIVALTGPQFGAVREMAQRTGVDVVVALDVSRSMMAEDIRPNRMQHAKYQVRRLLDRLQGDRVGLVLFAGDAFVQCPLTVDYGALELFLDVADVGSIPVQGTALGDALRVAGRCFDPEDRSHKVIVLLTDGEDHEGDPAAAAEEIAAAGVRVLTVGLGTPSGELIPVRDEAGTPTFHRSREGTPVKTRLDERVLREIAETTGGVYLRATLAGQELDALQEYIAGMEQKELGSARLTQYQPRFQIPLLGALLCLLAEAFLGDGRTRQQEWRGRFA